MPNVESFWRGELRSAISDTQTVPFTLSVSVVPNLENMYFTVDGATDDEEIFYFTTKSGTVGGPGTLNVTGRGFNKHNSSQSTDNYRPHGINSPYDGSINHIVVNQKAGLNEENIFTEVVIPPTFADDAAADASYTGGTAPNGSLFYSTAAGAVRVKQGGVWANSTGSADFAATRNIASASASNGELFRDTGSSNDLAVKDHGGTVRNLLINATGKFDANRYDFSADTTGVETTKPVNAATAKAIVVAKEASTAERGSVERATDDETLRGGTANVVPDAKQVFGMWGYTVGAGNTNTPASSNSNVAITEGSYTKKKEIVCNLAGTWRVNFSLVGAAATTVYGRIYKNGVAYGTERSLSASITQSYSEDLAFSAGDLIQVYCYRASATNVSIQDFQIKYDATQNLAAYVASKFTVNL
jgi:hypothetical protein